MSPRIERSDPPYLQIAQRIRADIESGVLVEGAAIPSAREIMSTWGVALATATKAQAQLRSEGLIRAVPGVGSVVTTRDSMPSGLQRLQSTHTRGRIYGVNERAVIKSSELVEAPQGVADALGVPAGSPVVRRERVIERDGEPRSRSVSWLPGQAIDSAPALLTTERVPEGTFAYLASALGLSVASGREQTCAGEAGEDDAAALGVGLGSPVLMTRTWYFLDDGAAVEYGEAVHPAGRWVTHDFVLS
jgi:DNA-binding GntR family transcriptional regulator